MVVDIDLKDCSYKITIDRLAKLSFEKKVAIVTNPKVSGLWLNTLLDNLEAKEVFIITINDGEKYKNMHTVEHILNNMFDMRLDRDSLLIAFGGGVIGDITGFCASIFQRGIEFVQIPTTLLSQVDASVGGKTGINNSFGKNLVGAFHQPSAVHIDTQFLSTLPSREFGAGVAEIIKMAVMFDKEFFDFLQHNSLHDSKNLKIAIQKAVELKARVVSQDEKENGIRAVLNYGHTFGHVIENQTGYSTYLHGEAVGIGMIMANHLAISLNLFEAADNEAVLKLLHTYNIPTFYDIDSIEKFYERFFYDKKSQQNSIKFILPRGIGDYKIVNNPDKELVLHAIQNFLKG
ncbi:MAG: 3-dehydroquinate synthase [Campylobacterota bacterium]